MINQNITNAKNESMAYTDQEVTKNNAVINKNIQTAKQESFSYTDYKFNQIEGQINSKFKQLDDKIEANAKKANAGIASVAAMSNIPYVNNQTFSAGVGVGNYRNGSAVAVGAQYNINENTHVRVSSSWNNTDGAVIGGGIAVGW
ncbi:YadA C-terminal domain-containing protein [Escherichia albertii]|uniref:YadA C-terminal domain-containing protein n=1 Tax=Escherichia albertii TaxID=208962 RepID=UPI0032D8C679